MLNQLERKLRPFAIPRLTLMLTVGQLAVWLLGQAEPLRAMNLVLIGREVADGEYWRLASFLFLPPGFGILSLFGLYMFNLMGTALEAQWGDFRYNLYLSAAWISTVTTTWFWPDFPATNVYIGGSVFLAFAYLFPDFEIALAFVLPVKVRWIAMFTWIGFAYTIAVDDWMTKALACAGVLNFFLFFGKDILQRAKHGKRRMERDVQKRVEARRAFHTCAVCGATEIDNPRLDFRFCSKCEGHHEYCEQHLRTHEHVSAVPREN